MAGVGSHVPLVDLASQHEEVADDVAAGFARVVQSGWFIGGPEVAAFEREMADALDVGYCVGVANGTDALELALRAAGIGTGDEVIVPANTFIATAEAVARAGATPVLVDCDPDTYLIDIEAASAAIGARTAAIVPVHLYGQMAPMVALDHVATRDGLALIEDAAQSHGATASTRQVGSFGVAASTSFYPAKNLGAYGDGGAVVTNDSAIALRVRRLGNHGSESKYEHLEPGFNSRLDALQAVVLRAKLPRLAKWNGLRSEAAATYTELLDQVDGVSCPTTLVDNGHVWHLYVVRVAAAKRDRAVAALHAVGVGAGIHYPVPIHLQAAFRHLGYGRGAFPMAETAADQIISLPLFPHITAPQQERVVESLVAALR